MNKSLWFAVSALAFCGTAFSQAPMTGHSTDAPAAGTPSAPLWTDKNGDGIIQRDEVTPGSQLARRFDTRDRNHDGQLTPDEYYLPK
ncbi:MAG TPA: hypothetical protein VFM56_03560 [Solimonas sp.]|jgi:hypothetical protein|nr:hypothetical protein [Solimonas sp.]